MTIVAIDVSPRVLANRGRPGQVDSQPIAAAESQTDTSTLDFKDLHLMPPADARGLWPARSGRSLC